MPGGEDSSEVPPGRIRCAACGTEQEIADARKSGGCVICSKPLFGPSPGAEPADKSEPFDLDTSEVATGIATAAAAVPRQRPGGDPPAELHELLAADKRLTSILAFVPLWGPWHLRRSEVHTAQEKIHLGSLSLLLTVVVLVVVWILQPGAKQQVDATRARVDAQIGALGVLVESYALQHREYPDDAVWQRSLESGDLRFYDPWGRSYRYHRETDGYTIGTYGRDGVEDGGGDDTDVFRHFSSTPASAAPPGA